MSHAAEIIDTSTGEVFQPCSTERARDLTDKIKTSLGVAWELIKEAYTTRAWDALGYASWDTYCQQEFGAGRLRLPREERQEVVGSLRDAGLSVRAIAAATGTGTRQVQEAIRESAGVVRDHTSSAPTMTTETTTIRTTVTGTDGKTYRTAPKPAPQQPKRRPLPDQFFDAFHDLGKATDRIVRLTEDDRFTANAEQVAAKHRSDLLRAKQALDTALERLNEG